MYISIALFFWLIFPFFFFLSMTTEATTTCTKINKPKTDQKTCKNNLWMCFNPVIEIRTTHLISHIVCPMCSHIQRLKKFIEIEIELLITKTLTFIIIMISISVIGSFVCIRATIIFLSLLNV